jgi:hypothetical protein
MSTWYDYKITGYGSPNEIGKFFNIDPSDVNYLDSFTFSFGQKNGPGLRLEKVIKQNPGLVFLVVQSVECNPPTLWIEKYDPYSNEFQRILVESSDGELNKRLAQEYEKKFPYLLKQIRKGEYNWDMFCSNSPIREYLRYADSFQEMIVPVSEEEMDFDNMDISND